MTILKMSIVCFEFSTTSMWITQNNGLFIAIVNSKRNLFNIESSASAQLSSLQNLLCWVHTEATYWVRASSLEGAHLQSFFSDYTHRQI